MKVLVSKRLLNTLGLDANHIFKNNPDLSIINVSDALAFAVKMLHSGYSNIPDYSVYKLQCIYLERYKVRLHCQTIANYINTLVLLDQVKLDNNNTLHFLKVRSTTKERNFIIDFDEHASIKVVGREIAKHIFSTSMRVIGYYVDTINTLNNPRSLSALKKAQKRSRRCGFNIDDFKDNGVSYELLANRFNTSKQTVSSLIKKCCNDNIFTKVKHVAETVIRNAKQVVGKIGRFVSAILDEVTYYYYNENVDTLRLYKVSANTYVYNPLQQESLRYLNKRKYRK